MNKRMITEEQLRALYPSMPETFAVQMQQRLACLPQRKRSVGRRFSMGLVIAVLAVLLVAGALAAAFHWNVMEYLFGEEGQQATELVKNLELEETGSHVELTVNSALCDGELLALDWTVQNLQPEQPVYLQVDRFTANGVKLDADDTDDFDCRWLPDDGSDSMQGGETVQLPKGITGDTLHVEMIVGVYRPIAPIYRMAEFNAEEAAKKAAQGYYVIAEGDGLVIDDPAEGWIHCYGMLNDRDVAQFNRTEIHLAFDLNLKAASAQRRTLKPQMKYTFANFSATYTKAIITPAALYLELEIQPANAAEFDRLTYDGKFILTDGKGNELDAPFPDQEGLTEEQPDGSRWLRMSGRWVGMDAKDLPPEVSLTWRASKGGKTYVMPVSTQP